MKTDLKVSNQYQQVLWYLINWDSFSLVDVIRDSMFHKFQTRLSEIENEHGQITIKTRTKFINRFGRKSTFTIYVCSDIDKAKQIYKSYE